MSPRGRWSEQLPRLAVGCAALLWALFFLVPLAALAARGLGVLARGGVPAGPLLAALRLSLWTSGLAMLLLVAGGTPVAYAWARAGASRLRWLDPLFSLPVVLPPAVAGVALLLAFGRRGPVGGLLASWGVELAFTPWAVVLAQLFVASPLYLHAARAGFAAVPRHLEELSRTLGEGTPRTFWRVTVPLALPALLEGLVLAWARALGEFGATLLFAGNLPGLTQTLPLAIYSAMQSDLDAALPAALVLLAASLLLVGASRALAGRLPGGRAAGH